nr:hypothetical protein [Tanacetum cinerariifolium]
MFGLWLNVLKGLVAQGHTQEEGINYDEVFAPVARVEAIRLFLAYASFMGFTVYQMDVKSAFLYGTIDEELCKEFEALMHKKFQMSAMGELNFFLGQQVLHKEDDIFLSQDKYVGDILKKFGYSDVRSSNTPMDKENPWRKDRTGKDVDLHLYRSIIRSLRYLTASRPDIMFAVCACARHQVTPKECHLHAVKRTFRCLKGHPKLGLWYPKESPFDLVTYSDSDYGGATQDRKSTTGGCQFLGRRDCFEKKLIDVDHIHTDENVTDLLTKPFNAWRFQYLVKSKHNVDFHPMMDFIEASPLSGKFSQQWEKFKPLSVNFPLLGKLSTVSVFLGFRLTFVGTSKYWGVLRILMISFRLIPLKSEHNVDFHPMVDFIEVSPLRRNLKLKDEEGISSLPDTELFENLTLMGYNISPNQKFTFQKGKFSHQWKYLIHTIMQCLSPKSTGFNEFSSNIATALVCLAANRTYNFSKMIFDGLVKNVNNKVSKFLMYPRFLTMCLRMSQFGQITHTHTYVVPFHTRKLFTTLRVNSPSFYGRIVPLFDTMLTQQGEGSGTPTEPHHTPSPKAQPPSHTTHSSSSLPPVTTTIPTVTPSETTPIRQYTRRARIAQAFSLSTVADKPESPLRDISQGEACPTDFGFIADQDRATIAKSSTLPHDSAPKVTSHAAVKGSMQQTINELTALCTSLQRQYSELAVKFEAQVIEITRLKARLKLLEDRQGVAAEGSRDDTPIKGRSLDEGEAAAERTSDDTKEMATVLTSMDAATVLASGAAEVPTGSGSIPTASPLLLRRRKGKEVMVESETPKKQKVQEQIDAQVARELEEQLEREDPRRSTQIARDAEIVRIHVEEELQIMIDGLDRNNEIVAKYLQEYHQFALELPIERRIELISDLTSEEVTEEAKSSDEVPEEKVKEMMQLVPIKEVYVEALQVKHPIIDWKHLDREDLNQLWRLVKETLSNRPPTSDKEMELWVELKWKLYDSCGVHHVTSKDKEIFMLVEKDYPLRKGLTLVMISYKLQVENYSHMANDLILKIYKIANSPRQQGRIVRNKMHKAFPLVVEVPTASEEGCHCQKKRDATARKITLLSKSRRNSINFLDPSHQVLSYNLSNVRVYRVQALQMLHPRCTKNTKS